MNTEKNRKTVRKVPKLMLQWTGKQQERFRNECLQIMRKNANEIRKNAKGKREQTKEGEKSECSRNRKQTKVVQNGHKITCDAKSRNK